MFFTEQTSNVKFRHFTDSAGHDSRMSSLVSKQYLCLYDLANYTYRHNMCHSRIY